MAKRKISQWDHLLHLSDVLAERARAGHISTAELRTYLGSAEEVFGPRAEPTVDYPSYAFHRFVGKLNEALRESERGIPLAALTSPRPKKARR